MTKKKIIGYASGAAVAVSLAIGGSMLNSKPVVDLTGPPMQENYIIEGVMPTASPTASPSPSSTPIS